MSILFHNFPLSLPHHNLHHLNLLLQVPVGHHHLRVGVPSSGDEHVSHHYLNNRGVA